MARIFICYRREDSSGHAGRLYDRLGARFGDEVFMDIDAIGPGVDFARLIDETIDTIEAVIVVMGQEWLSSADADGSRRLDDPEDLVRQEISVALARDVLVIPVLVQGAVLPKPADLPPELVGLTRHNAFEVSDARWNYDADRLVRALEEALAPTPTASALPVIDPVVVEGPAVTSGSVPASTPMFLAVTGALLVLLFGLFVTPTWHDEQIWFRIVVALAVAGVTAAGLTSKKWKWVMIAGSVGLAGFVIWVLMLISGHELSELMSFETDGVTNLFFLVGSALILMGGWLGSRSISGQPPPQRATTVSDPV
ncbi:MAG TPA: toll/interleukin-1 receptor domain-containing protein [Acidimicrobiia bacterium]|jgi:TIR domain|nr:toll/interleukin-1 receptor domain-containing protein [Acidimicrobiia bacterium]